MKTIERLEQFPMWIVILAAGQGSRMKSDIPKCLHTLQNITFLTRIMEALHAMHSPIEHIVIITQEKDAIAIRKELETRPWTVSHELLFQETPPRGTGHAVQCFLRKIPSTRLPTEIMVINGDMPYVNSQLLDEFLFSLPQEPSLQMALVTCLLEDCTGYGRVYCDEHQQVQILEEKDCSLTQRTSLNLCNMGVYWFSIDFLRSTVDRLEDRNASRELYLTQLVEFVPLSRIHFHSIHSSKQLYFKGVNTPEELETFNKILKCKID